MTATIKVEVDETLARRFKKKAFENYGYKKGAMKKALEELDEGLRRSAGEGRLEFPARRPPKPSGVQGQEFRRSAAFDLANEK